MFGSTQLSKTKQCIQLIYAGFYGNIDDSVQRLHGIVELQIRNLAVGMEQEVGKKGGGNGQNYRKQKEQSRLAIIRRTHASGFCILFNIFYSSPL